MNIPDTEILRRIDGRTRGTDSFALYRLPWTDECHLVWQTSGETEALDDIALLDGRTGFVIAPFRPSEAHPLALIRPDVTATGWEAIGKAMLSTSENDVLQEGKHRFTDDGTPCNESRYAEVFDRFILPLKEGRFQKLVLSRTARRTLPDGFSPLTAFVRACNSYPRMMIYLCHTPLTGTWIGSTPEILLSGQGEAWHTVALAGTMPMQGEEMPDGWTPKNREEQALVADYVRGIVRKHSGKRALHGQSRTVGAPENRLPFPFEGHLHIGRLAERASPHPRRMRTSQGGGIHFHRRQRGLRPPILFGLHRLVCSRRADGHLRQPPLHGDSRARSHTLCRRRHPPLIGNTPRMGGDKREDENNE